MFANFKMYRVLIVSVVILVCTVAAAPAPAPAAGDAQAKILKYENTNDGQGNYEFSYETSNGLMRYETGRLVNIGQPDEHIVVRGYYSYIDSDGVEQFVRYTADENGFQILEPAVGIPIAAPPAVVATLLG